MQVFISSLITNFDEFRTAAKNAVRSLNLNPVVAEDFGARPETPQVACLEGVRRADALVLILGQAYGAQQQSGLSATHEEFREARERRPVFAFIQNGIRPEESQRKFINEVQSWVTGVFTASFTDAADLHTKVIGALHEWRIGQATGGVSEEELKDRALQLFNNEGTSSWHQSPMLELACVPGPTQALIRPVQLEESTFARNIRRYLLDEDTGIFTSEQGTSTVIEGHALHFKQEDRFFQVDEQGSLLIGLRLAEGEDLHSVILEEDVQANLRLAISFSATILNFIDSVHRATHIYLAARIEGGDHRAWRTQAEHSASPDRIQIDDGSARVLFTLSPPVRPRATLVNQGGTLADDLLVLLRRQFRSPRYARRR